MSGDDPFNEVSSPESLKDLGHTSPARSPLFACLLDCVGILPPMNPSQLVGTMAEGMLSRYSASPEARSAMDEEVRKAFKVPANRYFTVTLHPSPPGQVFVDNTRSRAVSSVKLSKSG